jgi:CheY-like chemotaxis protein
MENLIFPAQVLARYQLEDVWRRRFETAQARYKEANARYRRLLQEEPDGQPPGADSPLALARREESEALEEYSHTLRIFTDLTIHGKLPDESSGGMGITSKKGTQKISVVDDDESIRDSTRTLLRSAGYEVATFASGELFLDSGSLTETECIVLDVRMPGMDGLELQRRLNESQAGVPIVFLTAHDDARSRRLAMDGGAVDFLCKPFEANTLVTAVEAAITRHALGRR